MQEQYFLDADIFIARIIVTRNSFYLYRYEISSFDFINYLRFIIFIVHPKGDLMKPYSRMPNKSGGRFFLKKRETGRDFLPLCLLIFKKMASHPSHLASPSLFGTRKIRKQFLDTLKFENECVHSTLVDQRFHKMVLAVKIGSPNYTTPPFLPKIVRFHRF